MEHNICVVMTSDIKCMPFVRKHALSIMLEYLVNLKEYCLVSWSLIRQWPPMLLLLHIDMFSDLNYFGWLLVFFAGI